MSFFGSIWNGLKPSYIKAGTKMLGSLSLYQIGRGKGDIKYVSKAGYKSILEYVLRQETMSVLQQKLHDLIFDTVHAREMATIEENRKFQEEKQEWLIQQREDLNSGLGQIDIEGGDDKLSRSIKAATKYGQIVPEALLMAYEGEERVKFSASAYNQLQSDGTYTKKVEETIETRSVFFIDLSPTVTVDSQKNLVLTTVQGRDFSRKELVSGGDLKFKISGSIVYDEPDIYPENDVKKFVNIMQHNGPVRVNHRLFKTLGVKQIIIQDYTLEKPDMLNIQPYSFSCVAIEPDEELVIQTDTIEYFNTQIASSPMNSWIDLLLDNEVADIAQDIASYGLAALLDTIPSTRV